MLIHISTDDVRESIEDIQANKGSVNQTDAIKELFWLLIYSGQSFYMAVSKGSPYIAPMKSNQSNLCIRIFTDEDLAQRILVSHPAAAVQKLPWADILKMANYAFYHGASTIVLNEGDKWAAISISDYLKLFIDRVLIDPMLYSEACVKVLEVLGEIRHNSIFRYGLILAEDGSPHLFEGMPILIRETGDLSELMPENGSLAPVNLQSLYHLPFEKILVQRSRGRVILETALVMGGLSTIGCESVKDAPLTLHQYLDEPPTAYEWRASGISLSFPRLKRQEEEAQCLTLPDPDMERKSTWKDHPAVLYAAKAVASIKEAVWGHWARVRQWLADRRRKADISEPGPERGGGEGEREAPVPESIPVDEGKPSSRKRLVTGCLILTSIALLICLAGILVVQQHRHKQRFEAFCGHLSAREYASAHELYTETDFGSKAKEALSLHLDGLLIAYAKNQLQAVDVLAAFRALSSFIPIQQELEVAQITASKLEASKNAYVEGRGSADVYTRLKHWMQVMPLDSVNYAAVAQDVQAHKNEYASALDESIDRYSKKIWDFSAQRYEVLAYWYPEDPATAKWTEIYGVEQNREPLSYYPVKISDLYIRQHPNGYWSLYVNWQNTSVKTIQEISFSVVALDEQGELVTSSDSNGSWVVYDAVDWRLGPYEPGAGPNPDHYRWYGVFYGSFVADVKLSAINITYSDGSKASFTAQIDLSQMFPQS